MSLDKRYGVIANAILSPARYDNPHTFGAVYDQSRMLVVETLRSEPHLWRPADPAALSDSMIVAVTLEQGIYLGKLFYHFGHFLIETLPSLVWGLGSEGPLLFHPWKGTGRDFPRYIQFALEALAIDPSRIVRIEAVTCVKKLTVPPSRRIFVPDELSRPLTACAFRLLAAAAGSASRQNARLFLSRRFQDERRHPDNDRIEELFASHGYEVIAPETLDFADQVRMLKGARIVAGLDGSALHLCGFMNGGVCLILQTRAGRMGVFEAVNASAGVATLRTLVRGPFDPAALVEQIQKAEEIAAIDHGSAE